MDQQSLEDMITAVLGEVRAIRTWSVLPTVLTKARAAKELSISLSKLKVLIRDGQIMTCTVGKVSMIPASEVRRLATPSGPPPRRAVRKRAASARTATEEARSVREALRSPRR